MYICVGSLIDTMKNATKEKVMCIITVYEQGFKSPRIWLHWRKGTNTQEYKVEYLSSKWKLIQPGQAVHSNQQEELAMVNVQQATIKFNNSYNWYDTDEYTSDYDRPNNFSDQKNYDLIENCMHNKYQKEKHELED